MLRFYFKQTTKPTKFPPLWLVLNNETSFQNSGPGCLFFFFAFGFFAFSFMGWFYFTISQAALEWRTQLWKSWIGSKPE